MKPSSASMESDARRASARRTAWIVGAVAIAIYALAILEAVFKR